MGSCARGGGAGIGCGNTANSGISIEKNKRLSFAGLCFGKWIRYSTFFFFFFFQQSVALEPDLD